MNNYTAFFGAIFLAIVLVFTNPDSAKHSLAVKEILTKEFNKKMTDEIRESKNNYQSANAGIGLLLGSTLIDKIIDGYIDSENFYFFSLTKINIDEENRTIGFGILGKVYISEKLKDNAREIFNKKKQP